MIFDDISFFLNEKLHRCQLSLVTFVKSHSSEYLGIKYSNVVFCKQRLLHCNYRSTTSFRKRFFNASNGQWSKNKQQNLTDAVHWAVNDNIFDKNRLAIFGQCYGYYTVLAGLTFILDLFACGVDIVSPLNLVALMKSALLY